MGIANYNICQCVLHCIDIAGGAKAYMQFSYFHFFLHFFTICWHRLSSDCKNQNVTALPHIINGLWIDNKHRARTTLVVCVWFVVWLRQIFTILHLALSRCWNAGFALFSSDAWMQMHSIYTTHRGIIMMIIIIYISVGLHDAGALSPGLFCCVCATHTHFDTSEKLAGRKQSNLPGARVRERERESI